LPSRLEGRQSAKIKGRAITAGEGRFWKEGLGPLPPKTERKLDKVPHQRHVVQDDGDECKRKKRKKLRSSPSDK